MPTPEIHAVLSASSAERWLHCPGSVILTKDMPESTSEYAEEGRLAHAIAELKLTKYFKEGMGPKTFTTRLNKFKKDERYKVEMDHYTDEYSDYIKDLALSFKDRPFVAIEKKVDFSCFVPEGFGTSDCILIHGRELYVIDFKYGKGVSVEAENNPQMKLYAIGALMEYQMLYDIESIHMIIVQPRSGGIKSSAVSRDDLLNWGAFEVKPIAAKAHEGTDELHSGEWCRFCKGKALCRKHAEDVASAIEDFGCKLPPLLTNDEIGQILHRIEPLVKYVDAVKGYAQDTLLKGGHIPGWKMVEGRTVRAWDNQQTAFTDIIAAGIEESMLYERKPLTAPALEKVLGKPLFEQVAATHVMKTPGKPALAPDNDPRTEYRLRNTVEEDFSN